MANNDIKGENNPKWRGGGFKKCPICEKETWKKPYQIAKNRLYCSRDCGFKGRIVRQKKGSLHPKWKGDNAGYFVIHKWVRVNKGKTGYCSNCGENKKTEWANKSHQYKRNLDDWIELCKKCHHKLDRKDGWGKATLKFPNIG